MNAYIYRVLERRMSVRRVVETQIVSGYHIRLDHTMSCLIHIYVYIELFQHWYNLAEVRYFDTIYSNVGHRVLANLTPALNSRGIMRVNLRRQILNPL